MRAHSARVPISRRARSLGSPLRLKALHAEYTVHVRAATPDAAAAVRRTLAESLPRASVAGDDGSIRARIAAVDERYLGGVLVALEGIAGVAGVNVTQTSLEDVFIAVTRA